MYWRSSEGSDLSSQPSDVLYLASPFIKNNHKKKPFDCTNNIQFNIISKKIMDIKKYNFSTKKLL